MLEKMYKVKSCCGCTTLRMGSFVLASIGIVLAIIKLMFLLSSFKIENHADDETEHTNPIQAISIIFFCCEILTWTTLLIGTAKKNPTLVKISFVLMVIGIVVTSLGAIMFVAFATAVAGSCKHGSCALIWITMLSPFLPIIAFYIYGSIVILSFYHELKQNYGGLEQMEFAKYELDA